MSKTSQIFNISGNSSYITINLDIDPSIRANKASLINISIPKSYYNVRQGYNTMQVNENGSVRTITIEPANYNTISLRNVLITSLNTSGIGWVYTVSDDQSFSNLVGDNSKMTFSVSSNGGIQPIFIFSENSIYQQLGFGVDSYTFVADQLTSVNVTNIDKEGTLYLHSDLVSGSNNVVKSILANNATINSAIVYENQNWKQNSFYIDNTGNGSYDFWLTSENDQFLDMNGGNFVFSLMLFREDKSQLSVLIDIVKNIYNLIESALR